ncbi:MAG: hypothetical protein MUP66_02670 [Candidatus Nanohaloarchaeota archaeon QJJ-5]|nr:hypothetical protein [Candidatus Nanohaloarchaeota archaeon QJJ-5]
MVERLLLGIGQCGIDIVDNVSRDLSLPTAAVDLDKYALHASDAERTVYVKESGGGVVGEGFKIDHQIDLDSIEQLKDMLEPFDVVYVISALGGRAGGVLMPAVVKLALKMGKRVNGKIILPFETEESRRRIAELYLDTVRELFTEIDVYDNHEYVQQADGDIDMDSIHSLQSIFEEVNRDILREIQSDIVYRRERQR